MQFSTRTSNDVHIVAITGSLDSGTEHDRHGHQLDAHDHHAESAT